MKMRPWKDQQKRITIGLILMIVLCVFPLKASCISHQSNSENIFVYPHQDVQQIIDAAPAHSTLIFQNGTFSQSFQILKPLTLRGSSKASTMFRIETKPNNPAITISSKHVTLSNLTITNPADGLYTTAIRIDEEYIHIKDCHITNTPIGIAIWDNHTRISNCTFSNCSDEGILFISTSISTSQSNIVTNCLFINNCDGIELQHSSNNRITHCTFLNNSHAGIDGICDNNNNNTISFCTFKSNKAYDIYFASSLHNQIRGCDVENTSRSIVFTPSFSTNSIEQTNSIVTDEQMQQSPTFRSQQPFQKDNLIQFIKTKSIAFITDLIQDITLWFLQRR